MSPRAGALLTGAAPSVLGVSTRGCAVLSAASGQVGLFDAAVVMGPLPEGSFYALLAEHGDRIVRDSDFADCYSARMGRPSIPPSQLAKVLLLQHRTGVSDEQAMECVGWDLRWKVALGLAIDHHGWHPTSLTKFRARLLLHKKDGLALENTLRLARELGLLDGPVEQIVDSTPMWGRPRRRTPCAWSALACGS